jgi:hypothetical protein
VSQGSYISILFYHELLSKIKFHQNIFKSAILDFLLEFIKAFEIESLSES